MISYLLEKLYQFLFESDWDQMHVDKIIIVMYAIPLVLLICHTFTKV